MSFRFDLDIAYSGWRAKITGKIIDMQIKYCNRPLCCGAVSVNVSVDWG